MHARGCSTQRGGTFHQPKASVAGQTGWAQFLVAVLFLWPRLARGMARGPREHRAATITRRQGRCSAAVGRRGVGWPTSSSEDTLLVKSRRSFFSKFASQRCSSLFSTESVRVRDRKAAIKRWAQPSSARVPPRAAALCSSVQIAPVLQNGHDSCRTALCRQVSAIRGLREDLQSKEQPAGVL